MPECWLKPNRRVMWACMLLPLVIALLCVVAIGLLPHRGWWLAVSGLAGVIVVASCIAGYTVWRWAQCPRLAYADGQLLVYLRSIDPEPVPIEHVECFFLGQGDSDIPVGIRKHGGSASQTANIVTRLAESAPEFHHREIRSPFGQWCGGYIVIRGTWCEPINGPLLQRLNQRLAQVHRAQREGS
jgi:hypothetical protein